MPKFGLCIFLLNRLGLIAPLIAIYGPNPTRPHPWVVGDKGVFYFPEALQHRLCRKKMPVTTALEEEDVVYLIKEKCAYIYVYIYTHTHLWGLSKWAPCLQLILYFFYIYKRNEVGLSTSLNFLCNGWMSFSTLYRPHRSLMHEMSEFRVHTFGTGPHSSVFLSRLNQ